MAKYKHMTLDERIGIQKGLKEKKSFVEIGTEIDRDASTVAKEIKSHLLVKETGTKSRPYNPCKHRYNCGRQENVCPQCYPSIHLQMGSAILRQLRYGMLQKM